jgi:predicted Zn finger-like uncharacterized protein
MNVSCPDCRSIFRVDPAKVPSSGVRARCSVCSGVISIPAPSGQAPAPTGGSRPETPASEPGSRERPRSTPPAQGGWDPPPFGSAAPRAPAAPAAQRTPAAPPVQRTPAVPPPQPRQVETPAAPRPRPESVERASITATATPPSPSTGLPEFSSPPTPPSVRPQSPGAPVPSGPSSVPPSTSSGPSAPPFVPSGSPPRPPAPPRPSAPPLPSPSPAAGDGGARRPLNPFLSKDPNQRAKRLARALVSDIITYHPAKHAEGIRDGTLKQLFREEIKKSFEEYIAQVGQQLAESTTYFQEALNEVLAAGKKIF